MVKEDDKIYTMYKQYKALIHKDAVEGSNTVYGTDQLAAWLTVGHTLDNMVSLLEETKTLGTATTSKDDGGRWDTMWGVGEEGLDAEYSPPISKKPLLGHSLPKTKIDFGIFTGQRPQTSSAQRPHKGGQV